MAVLGVWTARAEEARAEREIRGVLGRKLQDLAALIDGAMADLERGLQADTDGLPADPDPLRAYRRLHPRLAQLLVVDSRGRLRFPPLDGAASDDERRFADAHRDLWERGSLSHPARDERTGRSATHGWLPAAGDDGLGLFYWHARPDGGRVAVLLPSATLLEVLIARLPSTPVARPPASYRAAGARTDIAADDERIALEDPTGKIAYQWGAYQPPPDARPPLTRALGAPLGAWRLSYLGPVPAPGRATIGIVAGLAALAAVIAAAGTWLYRESTRELRLAGQRVSFVNQVSHELKTPLTNIRMYAELLEDHIADDDGDGRKRLGIVVTESQRLSRLITNILTLSRRERGHLTLHPAPAVVDDVVREVLAQFTPGLDACAVTVRLAAAAPAQVLIDGDALRQILGNMLSNVEKYAPGGALVIETRGAPPLTMVTVQDSGPGIPAAEAERIFLPFVRLVAPAHEGIPGTGIGLGIARDLAVLHGGGLRLEPAPPGDGRRGARFVLMLRTEAAP
jgi:signal transduction histidine kinase